MSDTQGIAQPGQRIGDRYEVVRVLGKGGFGVVYHARTLDGDREFALKTYLKSSLDRKAIARFRQESEIWIALGMHPYLVQAYFADMIDGRLYVGMEMITPGASGINDLEGYLKSGGVTPQQLATWGVQLCHGMEYAALCGIRAHRDLKPANVMINERGEVKISDFGLATQPSSHDETDVTATQRALHAFRGQTMYGIGFGTPTHMPPEQFEDAASCDARSDIYATGVMLYQLTSGQLPVTIQWPTDQSLQTRMQFWKDMEEAHRSFVYTPTGSPLDSVIERCMAADADNRYQDFQALRMDLERVAATIGAAPVPSPTAKAPSTTEWVTRGKSLTNIERFSQAVYAFDQVLQKDPDHEGALMGKGNALLGMDRIYPAQPLFDRLIEKKPGSAESHSGLGRCLHGRGLYQESLQAHNRAVELAPGSPDAWVYRASLLRTIGSHEEGMASLDRALALQEHHVGALAAKATVLAGNGQTSEALLTAERVLTINPLHELATTIQAACLAHQGRFEEALPLLSSLDRSLRLSPGMRLVMTEALARTSDPATALSHLEEIVEPEWTKSVFRQRINLLVDLYRMEEALDLVRSSVNEIEAVDEAVQFMIILSLTGHEKSALDIVSKWLSVEPGNEALCLAAANAAMHCGQDANAMQACEYGLSFHPESSALHYARGLLLARSANTQGASAAFEQVMARATSPILRERAHHNLCVVSAKAPEERFEQSIKTTHGPRLIGGERRVANAVASILLQANGWHSRYRVPALRPAVYILPSAIPVSITA